MEKRADVVIPDGRDAAAVDRSVRAVLEHSGPALYRAIVIDHSPPNSATSRALDHLASQSSQVEVLRASGNDGYGASCNRGLHASQNDAVLLSCGSVVGPGWLHELADVASADERTACVGPLCELWPTCTAVERDRGIPSSERDPATMSAACACLPRDTTVPSVGSSCVYLCRDKIDAVGLLDSSVNSESVAVDDWVKRAQALGFVAKRANRVYVGRRRLESPPALPASETRLRAGVLPECDRPLSRQSEGFRGTLDDHLPLHAVQLQATGRLRVALDLRALPREQVGTRTYAVSLARALAELAEIELTLLVRDPAQASGLPGRIVIAKDWRDDVEVIHKPAQVLDPRDLVLLFRSSAHLVRFRKSSATACFIPKGCRLRASPARWRRWLAIRGCAVSSGRAVFRTCKGFAGRIRPGRRWRFTAKRYCGRRNGHCARAGCCRRRF
jgi:hypothetical protein